jgi:hypothetical protein
LTRRWYSVYCPQMNWTFETFSKTRPSPCNWWSRSTTPLPLRGSRRPRSGPIPLQLSASSVGLCSGARTQPLCTFPERDGGEMVDCGGSVVIPPLPRCVPDPPCATVGPSFCSCSIPPPWPPLVVAPYGHCSCNVHPKPQSEVCISCSGLVACCCFISAGCDEAALCCSLRPHLEVVKSVKTKPPEFVSLVLPSIRVASGRHHWKVLFAVHCLRSDFFLSFKSHCKLLRKLKWCPLLSVGRPECRE